MTVQSKGNEVRCTKWQCKACFQTNYFPPQVYCPCGQGWLDID